MKELWVKVEESISEEFKNALLDVSKKVPCVIIAAEKVAPYVKSLGFTVASRGTNYEICLLDKIDENLIVNLKNKGKKVCSIVDVASRNDEDKVVKIAEKNVDY
ncbi:hypothetical protein DRO51_04495, partial [Candidatus Bathyarchaeota archaeon]